MLAASDCADSDQSGPDFSVMFNSFREQFRLMDWFII